MTAPLNVLKRGAARLPLVAMLLVSAVAPTQAQQTETPSPAPSPSRPLDFRLPPSDDGRTSGVQGPSDNGLPPLAPGERRGVPTPAPTPAPTLAPRPAAPQVVPTQPAPSTAAPTAAPAPARGQPSPAAQPVSAPRAGSAATSPNAVTIPAPGSEALPPLSPQIADTAPSDASAPASTEDAGAVPASAPVGGEGGAPLWAWLLAGLAALGAGIWYWRRRPALAADAPVETAANRAPATPRPAPQPVTPKSPVPKSLVPEPASPGHAGPAASPPVPAMPSALVTRPTAERRAEVAMALEVRGIRITPDQVGVTFALNLSNRGALAATGLMVRIALGQGSAMPEPVLARFFDGAGGSVLRDGIELAPGAGEQLSTEVMLPRVGVEPLMIGGKPMLVPVLAFDVTYHWDGEGDAFGQVAESFVLGRDTGAGGANGKLAPLPLDRPSLSVDRPAARVTAMRRTQ